MFPYSKSKGFSLWILKITKTILTFISVIFFIVNKTMKYSLNVIQICAECLKNISQPYIVATKKFFRLTTRPWFITGSPVNIILSGMNRAVEETPSIFLFIWRLRHVKCTLKKQYINKRFYLTVMITHQEDKSLDNSTKGILSSNVC